MYKMMKVFRSINRIVPHLKIGTNTWSVEVDSAEYFPVWPEGWCQRKMYRYLSYMAYILLIENANRDECVVGKDCMDALAPYFEEKEWEKSLQ